MPAVLAPASTGQHSSANRTRACSRRDRASALVAGVSAAPPETVAEDELRASGISRRCRGFPRRSSHRRCTRTAAGIATRPTARARDRPWSPRRRLARTVWMQERKARGKLAHYSARECRSSRIAALVVGAALSAPGRREQHRARSDGRAAPLHGKQKRGQSTTSLVSGERPDGSSGLSPARHVIDASVADC